MFWTIASRRRTIRDQQAIDGHGHRAHGPSTQGTTSLDMPLTWEKRREQKLENIAMEMNKPSYL